MDLFIKIRIGALPSYPIFHDRSHQVLQRLERTTIQNNSIKWYLVTKNEIICTLARPLDLISMRLSLRSDTKAQFGGQFRHPHSYTECDEWNSQ